MVKKQHLFMIDPISNLNLKMDTSIAIASEFCAIGDQVFVCFPEGVSYHSEINDLNVECFELGGQGQEIDLLKPALSPPLLKRSTDFTSIYMRKDPPFDASYLALTYLLDTAVERGVEVRNSPWALRNLNEKLAILRFPKWTSPIVVSSSPIQIWDFMITTGEADYILKPLFFHGGRGVTRLTFDPAKKQKLMDQLQKLCLESDVSIVQPFSQEIFKGELRCFGVCGQPLAWCRKTPAAGEFIASSYRGAYFEKAEPTAKQLELANEVLPALDRLGATMVGLDIIGEHLSEINLTSPRLLKGKGDSTNYERECVRLLSSETRG